MLPDTALGRGWGACEPRLPALRAQTTEGSVPPGGAPGALRLILELLGPQGLVCTPLSGAAWGPAGETISTFPPELISSDGSSRSLR